MGPHASSHFWPALQPPLQQNQVAVPYQPSPPLLLAVTPQASSYTAGGRTISFENPCDYFTVGKAKASTLSLSVLVAIEML